MKPGNVCEVCRFWRQIPDWRAGQCQRRGGVTTAGYSCEDYQPLKVAAVAPAGAFDVGQAADKVLARGAGEVSIESVHKLLHCTYRQAAEVVQELLRRGAIGGT